MTFTPWRLFLVALAGWMNRQQQEVMDYLRTENLMLREKLGGKRLILNESRKCRLATAAMKLGKELPAPATADRRGTLCRVTFVGRGRGRPSRSGEPSSLG